MVMKKICLLLVGVLALFSCEQEELGDFIDNDTSVPLKSGRVIN